MCYFYQGIHQKFSQRSFLLRAFHNKIVKILLQTFLDKNFVLKKFKNRGNLNKEFVQKKETNLQEEAIFLGFVDEKTFDKVVRPENMVGPKS